MPLHLASGSARIVKVGEDLTETLEVIPRQWKVIRPVREKSLRGIRGWCNRPVIALSASAQGLILAFLWMVIRRASEAWK